MNAKSDDAPTSHLGEEADIHEAIRQVHLAAQRKQAQQKQALLLKAREEANRLNKASDDALKAKLKLVETAYCTHRANLVKLEANAEETARDLASLENNFFEVINQIQDEEIKDRATTAKERATASEALRITVHESMKKVQGAIEAAERSAAAEVKR